MSRFGGRFVETGRSCVQTALCDTRLPLYASVLIGESGRLYGRMRLVYFLFFLTFRLPSSAWPTSACGSRCECPNVHPQMSIAVCAVPPLLYTALRAGIQRSVLRTYPGISVIFRGGTTTAVCVYPRCARDFFFHFFCFAHFLPLSQEELHYWSHHAGILSYRTYLQ